MPASAVVSVESTDSFIAALDLALACLAAVGFIRAGMSRRRRGDTTRDGATASESMNRSPDDSKTSTTREPRRAPYEVRSLD